MANPRKFDASACPALAGVLSFLDRQAEYFENSGNSETAKEYKTQASALYDYIYRLSSRRVKTEESLKARNVTIRMRGMQKRIAQLEEKLLLIRCSTDLHERGLRTSDNGGGTRVQRQARRIDHLEAKLLIIREMSDTNEAIKGHQPSKVGAPSRQIHDARIRVDVEKGLHGRHKPVVNPEKGRLLEEVISK